ncbi:MAG: sulfite exporter TauE/SafE family protein [Bacteriovoracaceae bacterium]|nr:sulfite exporter TauE/SafE family protein [Bacteriovoracaceae bacterium]
MTQAFIMIVALLASILTFFSGFGLGTILLPAMALFFPIAVAIVLTGIVHFINGILKVMLMRKHIHFPTLWRFGLLAIPSAFIGAWLLTKLEGQTQVFEFVIMKKEFVTAPIKFTVGLLMMVFALIEGIPQLKNISIDQKYLPLGGIISGFFGGLTGNQGAFRSMFLVRAKLSKEQFIATGSAFSFFVDLTRLSVYFNNISQLDIKEGLPLLALACVSALTGVIIGNRLLKKVNMRLIRYIVAISIFILGALLLLGII